MIPSQGDSRVQVSLRALASGAFRLQVNWLTA
jgi:hypothetical protein